MPGKSQSKDWPLQAKDTMKMTAATMGPVRTPVDARAGAMQGNGGAPRQTVFDQRHYLELIVARGKTIRRVVENVKLSVGLRTALDAGCGTGFFAQTLQECGLSVQGFDGREENVSEARRRYAGIAFEQGDVQDAGILRLGTFDLVLCFGLLYHLENPMLAIRHLHALTGKALLIESMCLPDGEPYVLLRTEPRAEDQSLTDMAFYASEGCLVKMCYRAGFSQVFRVHPMPEHDAFRETAVHRRKRTVLLAVQGSCEAPGLEFLEEPREAADPWEKIPAHSGKLKHRVRRFLAKPLREKIATVRRRVRGQREAAPVPVRLPFGALWLARNDHIGQPVREGRFENAESAFVERWLQPGMTVLDIGAHHGYYTLLASRRVGSEGRVVAFEPSPREREALRQHVKLNRCGNVLVEGLALGSENKEAEFYVVQGSQTGCNSLRRPLIESTTVARKVQVKRLDDWMKERKIERVDFIKLDVEGGELEVLQGAEQLLERRSRPRPVVLAEVQDLRTGPWGYPAKEIIEYLRAKGYEWFGIAEDGTLTEMDVSASEFDGNFVACPAERIAQAQAFVRPAAESDGSSEFCDTCAGRD